MSTQTEQYRAFLQDSRQTYSELSSRAGAAINGLAEVQSQADRLFDGIQSAGDADGFAASADQLEALQAESGRFGEALSRIAGMAGQRAVLLASLSQQAAQAAARSAQGGAQLSRLSTHRFARSASGAARTAQGVAAEYRRIADEAQTLQQQFLALQNSAGQGAAQTGALAGFSADGADAASADGFGGGIRFSQDSTAPSRYFSRGAHYEEFRNYWENEGQYSFSRYPQYQTGYIRAGDIEGVDLSDREVQNLDGFWTRNGRYGCSKENYTRMASQVEAVRQGLAAGRSLDELAQDPALRDTVNSYYREPLRVVRLGSFYVFDSDGRHRILAAQSLGGFVPVRIIGEYARKY